MASNAARDEASNGPLNLLEAGSTEFGLSVFIVLSFNVPAGYASPQVPAVMSVTQACAALHNKLKLSAFGIARGFMARRPKPVITFLDLSPSGRLRFYEEVGPGIGRHVWGVISAVGADSRAGVGP